MITQVLKDYFEQELGKSAWDGADGQPYWASSKSYPMVVVTVGVDPNRGWDEGVVAVQYRPASDPQFSHIINRTETVFHLVDPDSLDQIVAKVRELTK